MKGIVLFTVIIVFYSCTQTTTHVENTENNIHLISIEDTPSFNEIQDVYVSAYSNLYYMDGSHKLYYTVVLSLRNISFSDTVYFTQIDYYGSNGKIVRSYLNSTLVLEPMESIEYIVNQEDKQGGAGANFVVSYGKNYDMKNPPVIETVMSGTAGQYGFAFKSNGIPIKK